MKKEITSKLKSLSYGLLEPLKTFFEEDLVSFYPNKIEFTKLITDCAMIASRKGLVKNVQFLVSKNKSILQDKENGIFRMTAEIEHFSSFVIMTDYLLNSENKEYININANNGAFLKECINKDKLNYIQYIIEQKKMRFDLNNESIVKTLLRTNNNEIFNYLLLDLENSIKVKEIMTIEKWALENNYEDQWNKIKKKYLLLHLQKNLKEKENPLNMKTRKI